MADTEKRQNSKDSAEIVHSESGDANSTYQGGSSRDHHLAEISEANKVRLFLGLSTFLIDP